MVTGYLRNLFLIIANLDFNSISDREQNETSVVLKNGICAISEAGQNINDSLFKNIRGKSTIKLHTLYVISGSNTKGL